MLKDESPFSQIGHGELHPICRTLSGDFWLIGQKVCVKTSINPCKY